MLFRNQSLSFGIAFIAIVLIEVFSQISIKKYVSSNHSLLYLLLGGVVGYMIYGYLLTHIFASKKLSITNALVSQTSVVLLAIVGYFFFQERLTFKETLGLLFAFISVILLI